MIAAFDACGIASDAEGRCCFGATDRTIRMIDRSASCFHDVRCPELIERPVVTLMSQRVFGIALRYEDLNDRDKFATIRSGGTLSGELTTGHEDCAPMARRSTLEPARAEPPGAEARYHKISTRCRSAMRAGIHETGSSRRTSQCRTRSSSISMRPTIQSAASRAVLRRLFQLLLLPAASTCMQPWSVRRHVAAREH